MTDFAALSAAQAPLPLSATLDPSLHNLIFNGRANGHSNGSPLPNFTAATLQFLRKLSPHLQKAALSAILNPKNRKSSQKSSKPKFQSTTTTEFTTTAVPTTTPSTTTTTTTETTTSTTTTPLTTTTPDATTTTRRFRRKPRKPSTPFTNPTTTSPFRTPPSFHWTEDDVDVPNMSWESGLNQKAYHSNNALQEVDRIGLPSSNTSSDAGIVLLVAIFNLLAVVIYAAHRHVTNIPSLPARLLDWQIQKVLDELVLRVHSSRGAAQLLARALPTDLASNGFSGRSVQGFTSENGLKVLDKAKSLLLDVAASPTASNMARLPMGLYRPLTQIYNQVMTDLKKFMAEGGSFSSLDTNFEGRSISEKDNNGLPTWLKITHGATQLNSIQWDGVLRTLTILGRSRSLASSEAIARALMSALITPEGTGRSRSTFDFQTLTRAALGLSSSGTPNKTEEESSPGSKDANQIEQDILHESSRVMRRMGYVEDASGLTGAGGELGDHWAQRWFSLVTRLAPVALDATTLYARAHSEPTCLRSLLCSINFSWKKVGPLQAALTPLLSVLTGWALEDRAPHPLGESLSAIRGGWLGRDCAALYPECSISRAPNDIVSQALTYFSRLEIAVNKNPKKSQQKQKLPAQDERQREDDQILIYDEYDSNDIAFSEDETFNSNRPKNDQAAPPIAKTSNNYHTHDQPDRRRTSEVSQNPKASPPNQVSGFKTHEIHTGDDQDTDHTDHHQRESSSNQKHGFQDREDKENYVRGSVDDQRDRHATTNSYDAYQSYENHNPHYDSYELYRKEAYGALVPEYELREAGETDTRHREWSGGQEDLTLNHKMEENDIRDLENNDRRTDVEESRSTVAWDTGFKQRYEEDSYPSSSNHRSEDSRSPAPPNRREDSYSPAPHRREETYSPSPSNHGEESYSPAPHRREETYSQSSNHRGEGSYSPDLHRREESYSPSPNHREEDSQSQTSHRRKDSYSPSPNHHGEDSQSQTSHRRKDSYSPTPNNRREDSYSQTSHRREESYSPSPNHRIYRGEASPSPRSPAPPRRHPSRPPLLYERYDSPSMTEGEVPLEDQSVITGMDLQDAPSSHAAPLVTSEEQLQAATGLKKEPSSSNAGDVRHEEHTSFFNGHQHHQEKTNTNPDIRLQVNHRRTPERPVSHTQQKLQYHTISREPSNLSKKPKQTQSSRPERRPTKYAKNTGDQRPLYKRPDGASADNKPKQRIQYPKSRILFSQSNNHGQASQRRKQLWQSQERPSQGLSVRAYMDGMSETGSGNTIDLPISRINEHRRRNSKMPTEPDRSSSGLRSSPGDIVNGKLEIPLYTSYQNPNHRYETTYSSEQNRVTAEKENSLPGSKIHAPARQRVKYKYGLRRGLPAVTVDNFTKSKISGASTIHLSKRTRPWFSYNSSRRRNKYPHKAEAKPQAVVQMKTTISPMSSKAVAHFGPDDAITDEYRNTLLFQYIRDQKKDVEDSTELTTESSQ